MTTVWDAVIPIALFMIVGWVIKIILENSTRRKLIDKGMVDENVKYLQMDRPTSQTLQALKWGMVAIGLGIALFIGQMVEHDVERQVTFGCMLIFGGLALVIYYLIAARMLKKSREENSGQSGLSSE